MPLKKAEIYNSLSMIPGIAISLWWIFKTKYKMLIPASGYIITCIGSIIFHTNAIKHDGNMRLLRYDLICQNIGILANVMYSPLYKHPKIITSMLYIAYTTCFLTNLNVDNERFFSYIGNGINILIASSFNHSLAYQFIGSSVLFLYNLICRKNDYTHALWHLVCHLIVLQYFNECNLYQLYSLKITNLLPHNYNYINLIDHYSLNTNKNLYYLN